MSWLSNDSSFLGVDISKALHGMDTTTITEDFGNTTQQGM